MRRMHEGITLMKALIITVAGTSSRFSKSLGHNELKCIYSEPGSSIKETLLYRLLEFGSNFDKIVVVGGYRFGELKQYISEVVPKTISQKIEPIKNPYFTDRGSGWSLHLAVEALKNESVHSVVFAEGDLFFDEKSFRAAFESSKDVITCNNNIIDAEKSVIFYCDKEMHPHYIYDTSHGAIEIKEPFTKIYNSGQVWRFANPDRLFLLDEELPDEVHSRTNLELINAYFSSEEIDELDIVEFQSWMNCNTVDDYRKAFMPS